MAGAAVHATSRRAYAVLFAGDTSRFSREQSLDCCLDLPKTDEWFLLYKLQDMDGPGGPLLAVPGSHRSIFIPIQALKLMNFVPNTTEFLLKMIGFPGLLSATNHRHPQRRRRCCRLVVQKVDEFDEFLNNVSLF